MVSRYILILLLVFLLSGCSSARTEFENNLTASINDNLSLENDQDYMDYQKMVANSELNKEGIKMDEELYFILENVDVNNLDANEITTYGSVHISFVRNSMINVSYYNDENHEGLLGNECYMDPGETIYASIPKISSDVDSIYEFDGFKIYSTDSGASAKEELDDIKTYNVVVPDVPSKELIVEPYGHFKDVSLTLYDYYLDDDGKENDLPGKWTINGTSFQEKTVNIGKKTNFSVLYDYDDSEYYVSLTNPEALYKEKGIVSFEMGSSKNNDDFYLVELSKYVVLNIEGNIKKGIEAIKINGIPKEADDLKTLRCNDRVEIITKDKYGIINRVLNSETTPEELNNGGKKYSFIVPEGLHGNTKIELSDKINEYFSKEIKNGKLDIILSESGNHIEANAEVADSETVIVRIIPNNGYYVDGNDVKDNVYEKTMKYSDYKKKIDSIISSHKCIQYTRVFLDTSDEYGVVSYKVNEKEIKTNSTLLRRDQKIKLEYQLTNKEYKITKSFIDVLGDKYKSSYEIKVSDLSSGTILKRENYIQIEKDGN